MIDHSKILAALFAKRTPVQLAAELGITKQAVHQWRKVPPERAMEVSRLSGMPLHELRPDIYPEPAE